MCGILGRISCKSKDESFIKGLDSLAHRGPDGFGIWEEEAVSLGHRRLSIIDLTANGEQPMHWGDRFVITFNGEIYNYIELREELARKGIYCKTQSDTEVLLALYANEGPRCLNRLNGMWAFAIYDRQDKTIFLARDRMGKKPLFYILEDDQFAFASEMKAIIPFLNDFEVNIPVYQMACANVFSYESTTECLFKGIKRFPAASYGFYKNNQLTIHSYWSVLDSIRQVPNKYEDQVEEFRELFFDSCKLRMRSDVPIGTALSGGIDSSATISMMASIAKKNSLSSSFWQHAYVATFPGSAIDESKEAKLVTDYLQIPASFINVNPLIDIQQIEYFTYLVEDLYLTSPLPFIQLYRKIKESGTTVTLDGHGGDELFGGYPFDIQEKLQDDYPNFLKMWQTEDTIQEMRDLQTNATLYSKFSGLSNKYFSYIKHNVKNASKDIAEFDFFNNQLYKSSFKTVLPTLLRNYDRYAMINGVEIRMPFLDHRLVAFAFSIPGSSKVRNGYSKAIIRDAMKGFFPDHVRLLKKKTGFNTPFAEWIRGPLKEWITDEINSTAFNNSNLINQSEIKANISNVLNASHSHFADGENAWISFMPYIWEKSLRFYR